METTFERYEYPLKDSEGEYVGSYTIKKGVTPKKLKGEKLVETFTANIYSRKEWKTIIDNTREY